MYDNLSIKLYPYLGRSKNLMEIFVIIGYEEKILEEYSPNIIENQNNLELSVLSGIISDLSHSIFNPDDIIEQIYPEKPKIIKILKKEELPKPTSVLFYSCFDSLDGNNKVLY